MDLFNQIFAVIFYILFFYWAFTKIRASILVSKFNCRDTYKEMKNELKSEKTSKRLFNIIKSCGAIFVIYLIIGLAAGLLALFLAFITLGGAAYVGSGADASFYKFLMKFVRNWFGLFKYIHYYIYIMVYIISIRAAHINNLLAKQLKNNY